jgi:hypothetical protein
VVNRLSNPCEDRERPIDLVLARPYSALSDGGMAKSTWVAVIVCVIAVIVPGLIVGAAVSYVFRMSLALVSAPDPLSLHFLFGIDTISKILSWIFYVGVSSAVHGGIAGAVAVGLTRLICRGANIAKAAFITGGLYTGLIALAFLVTLFTSNFTSDAVASVFQLVGLWVGLISVAVTAPQFKANT